MLVYYDPVCPALVFAWILIIIGFASSRSPTSTAQGNLLLHVAERKMAITTVSSGRPALLGVHHSLPFGTGLPGRYEFSFFWAV